MIGASQVSFLQPHISSNDEAVSARDVAPEEVSQLTSSVSRVQEKFSTWIERAFGHSRVDADDVFQQTFATLAERGNIEHIDNLDGYVWTTALNIVRREKRAESTANAYVHDRVNGVWGRERDDFDPERLLRAREELEIVARTLQDMPERRRTIFMAARFEGLSHAEAGKRAGVKRESATRHIALANEAILEALYAADERPESAILK